MRSEFRTRQWDIIPERKLGRKITVIGAGAVGSHVCTALARMGFGNLHVWDHDEVSEENMNCQGYGQHDIGQKKVDALAARLEHDLGLKINAIPERCEDKTLDGIVISAVDSMSARKNLWESAQYADMFIDPRMGAEVACLYAMKPTSEDDREAYEKTLHTDDESVHESCTAKATVYTAFGLSSCVVKAVKDYVLGDNYTRVIDWNIGKNDAKFWQTGHDQRS